MPQRPQDHVHRLVRSMSGAEKRYFKLYASRHVVAGHSNHQELFNAIAAMPEYDERALRKKFAGAAFLHRFSITKRRLYESVLNSLDAFHADSSVDDKLRHMLHHVELLSQRALYADAAKVLQGARTLARTHDKQALLLQVAEWERRAMERGNYSGISAADLEARANSIAGVADEWQEVDRLWQVKSASFLLIYRSGQAPGPKEIDKLETLAREPLLAEGAELHSTRARFLHHHVRSALAYAKNDLRICEEQLTACADVLKAAQKRFQNEPDLMLGVMGNLAHVRMRLGRHQEALDGFREFRKLPLMMATAPSPDLEMKLFVMGSSLELSVLSAKGEFGKAMERLDALEAGLETFGERVSTVRRAELALQAGYACFGSGEHDRALRWCNRLLNEKGIETHTELHALGRMLNIAALVELSKEALLVYVVRNTQRALNQHGTPYVMERVLLKHAETLANPLQNGKKAEQWQTLAHELEATAKDPREASVVDHIDLVSWAHAKAGEMAFGELMRNKWVIPARAKGAVSKKP